MNGMINDAFCERLASYTNDKQLTEFFWNEIAHNYNSAHRHYHTLTHLDNLLQDLFPFKNTFNNWDVVVFAIAYHDIVYDVKRNDNELQSAEVARERLRQTSLSEKSIQRCVDMIMATKTHAVIDEETNLFTDADLSILGADEPTYKVYATQIRKEFSIYPDTVYNSGRRNVLQHFLNMPRIFKSKAFYEKYEVNARRNLEQEFTRLTN